MSFEMKVPWNPGGIIPGGGAPGGNGGPIPGGGGIPGGSPAPGGKGGRARNMKKKGNHSALVLSKAQRETTDDVDTLSSVEGCTYEENLGGQGNLLPWLEVEMHWESHQNQKCPEGGDSRTRRQR